MGKSGLRGPSLNHSQRHRFKVRGMASGLELVRIDGSTPPITRQGLIAKFMAQALRRTSVASVASGARALQSNFSRTSGGGGVKPAILGGIGWMGFLAPSELCSST